MRWGGRDESTDDHMTTSICLEVGLKTDMLLIIKLIHFEN